MNKKKPDKKHNKKPLIAIFRLIFIIVKFLFNFTFNAISIIIGKLTNKFRFSITFKITFTYVFIFFLFFSAMAGVIMGSYNSFLQSGSKGNYASILSGILFWFNILGIFFIAVAGSKASRRLLSPIDKMTKMVKNISINELDKRLDISGSKDELKDLAQTFNETLDRLENSVELQNQFVSDASHELRTPISVIQGYSNLIDRWGKDDPKILEESIASIKSEAEVMKNLVEKLLFLARGDKNTQKVEKLEFMLNEVIDEVIRETQMIDKVHDIKNINNEEIKIWADRNLLKEAIRIFVDNSIKYTPSGGSITLNSWAKGKNAIITIEDTGCGIAKEDIPNIFNRFYRADKSRTKASGGTGLGLAISKWIIEHHYGTINVTSQINVGTTIKVEIPIKAS
jgi:two-component system, OmpR family, sensor histidine kinase ArlS